MNILPFISVFLLVFALLSSSFLGNVKEIVQTSSAHKNYMAEERALRNEIQSTLYKRGKQAHKKPQKEKKDSRAPVRRRIGSSKEAKLNLFSLINETPSPKELEKVFTQLLQTLYGEKLSSEELAAVHKQMAGRGHALIKAAKKKGEVLKKFELTDLLDVEDPIAYKLLRGTHQFDLEQRVGIVPLGELIYFEKRRRVLYRKLAPPALLSLTLGKEKTAKILAKEKMEERALTLGEFQSIAPDKWLQGF